MSKEKYLPLVQQSAAQYGLDPVLFAAQIEQESGWNPSAKSKAGARGIAQFMPDTAKQFKINPLNPEQAIPAAAKYLAQLRDRFGSEDAARLAYNWGQGNVSKWIKGERTDVPKEAQEYNAKIYGRAGLNEPTVRIGGKQLLPAGVEPSEAGAGRGFVNPGSEALLTAAMAEINDNQPAGAYLSALPGAQQPEPVAQAEPAQPDWRNALAGLGTPQAPLPQVANAWEGFNIDELQSRAEKDQDQLVARMFSQAPVDDTPDIKLPSGVDRYLNQILS